MRFVARLVASVYSPPFYAAMPARPGGQALLYYLLLVLVLTLVYSLASVLPVALELHAAGPKLLDQAVSAYPDQLQVRIDNGRVSTNVPEPYVISAGGTDSPRNLLVIDTKTPFSVAQFDRYDTVMWLTSDSLVVQDQNPQLRTIDLSQIPQARLDKAFVLDIASQIRPWLALIGPTIFLLGLFSVYVVYLMRLLYLVVFALVIWLAARLLKHGWSYGVAYKAGLYAMTLPLIWGTLVGLTSGYTGFDGFPFMFSLLTLAVVVVNLWSAREQMA